MKDKPLPVFEIYAVVGDVYFEVEQFDPPIIVKPLESIQVQTKPYSRLSLQTGKFEPSFIPSENIGLYLVLDRKVVKCKMVSHPYTNVIPALKKYRIAVKETATFNGQVYNEDSTYAIIYRVNSETKTAIVDRSGFICRNWNFWFNTTPKEHLKSESDLGNYLETVEFNKAAEWFKVQALN
jgi:hypothetical protein